MSIVNKLLIRSADRITGSPDDFYVKIPPLMDVHRVSLLSASIPNTLYNITSANNTIYWNRGGALSATIPVGAYSVTAVCAAIAAAMDAEDGAETYQVSYSVTTMKITITCSAACSLTCTVSQASANAIWYELGFDTTADTSSALTHTADNVLRLDFPAYLMVSVSEITSAEAATTANFRANFIVPMTHISQYLEIYNEASNFENRQLYTLGVGINSLRVRLQKPDGTAADLNGGDWSMLLSFCRCPR